MSTTTARKRPPSWQRCYSCAARCKRGSLCGDCLRAMPTAPRGQRRKEPDLAETIALYRSRVAAGLDLWTGGLRP